MLRDSSAAICSVSWSGTAASVRVPELASPGTIGQWAWDSEGMERLPGHGAP
jgi:hypothetical protein